MQEVQEPRVQSLSQDNHLEAEMATHVSIFAWTEDLGGLQTWSHKEHLRKHTHTQNRMKGICEVWLLDNEQFYKAEDIRTEHLRVVAGFMQNWRIMQ